MSSRYSVTDTAILAPGHCWVSKNSEGPFIDTTVDVGRMFIERGRIYLAFDVIREMASVAGILNEGKSASVELKEQEWYNRGYSDALKENYGTVLHTLVDRIASSELDNDVLAGDGTSEIVEESAGRADEASQDASDAERKSSSASSRRRPARVSADSGDESSYRL
jgi:hypothetical protein